MNKVLFDQLNGIYNPMWNKATETHSKLTEAGYCASLGFYNNHYVKDGEVFTVEYFPIPVIAVVGIGDIGIDIDTCWVELHLDKNKAVLLDYPMLAQRYNIEVYGVEEYCYDFYNKQSDPYKVAEKINGSNEILINVTFYFDLDSNTDELIDVIKQYAK